MSDLISRQSAIDALMPIYKSASLRNRNVFSTARKCMVAIEELPSAQPDIIHCRDCKHWREGDAYSYCQKLFNCGVLDVYDYMRAEDDFCSLAERWEE